MITQPCQTCGGLKTVFVQPHMIEEPCGMCDGTGVQSVQPISQFKGPYRPLSNMYPCRVEVDDIVYNSSEHGYQAEKSVFLQDKEYIRAAIDGKEAKKRGQIKRKQKIVIRRDWEQVKGAAMLKVLRAKFTQNPELGRLLLDTGYAELVEGNTWHDNLWGNCTCGGPMCCGDGENWLGKLLMLVRGELRTAELYNNRTAMLYEASYGPFEFVC